MNYKSWKDDVLDYSLPFSIFNSKSQFQVALEQLQKDMITNAERLYGVHLMGGVPGEQPTMPKEKTMDYKKVIEDYKKAKEAFEKVREYYMAFPKYDPSKFTPQKNGTIAAGPCPKCGAAETNVQMVYYGQYEAFIKESGVVEIEAERMRVTCLTCGATTTYRLSDDVPSPFEESK